MLRYSRCLSTQSPTQQNVPFDSLTEDDWNNWEFGSFTTRSRKTTEHAEAERSSQNNVLSRNCRNIDNDWSFLSDSEVEIGILALKAVSTEGRVLKLEQVLQRRTGNVRLVFVRPLGGGEGGYQLLAEELQSSFGMNLMCDSCW